MVEGNKRPMIMQMLFFLLMMVFFVFFYKNIRVANIILFVFMLVGWIWMLVSCKRTNDEQKEKIQKKDELTEKENQVVDSFWSDMSNAINGSINEIVKKTETALCKKMPESVRGDLTDILFSGKNLLGTVEDIVVFSQIKAENLELLEVNYSLNVLLKEVVNAVVFRVETKPIQLKVEVDPETPNDLFADAVHIRQVLIRLLNNAVKFTEEGYVMLSVSYEKKEDNVILHFNVFDSGCKMKQRLLELEKRQLEFPICQSLVQLMGGTIRIDSATIEGVSVYMSVPQKIQAGSLTYGQIKESEVAMMRLDTPCEEEEEKKDTKAKNSPFLISLDEQGLYTEKAMVYMGNNEEQYAEILRLFVEEAESRQKKLDRFYREENWKEYAILIHALKSNMRSFGADYLSQTALRLEKAAKEQEINVISQLHDEFLFEWQMMVAGLKFIPELGVIKDMVKKDKKQESEFLQEDVLCEEKYKVYAKEIAVLLDDFETEEAKERLRIFSEMVQSKEWEELLQKVDRALKNYDYDLAIKLLTE